MRLRDARPEQWRLVSALMDHDQERRAEAVPVRDGCALVGSSGVVSLSVFSSLWLSLPLASCARLACVDYACVGA